MLKLHFDMETQDPDDVLTLLIAATHPRVELVGITVTPGGMDQIRLAWYVSQSFGGKYVPVGGDTLRTKPSVSQFHDKWFKNAWREMDGDDWAHAPSEVLVNSAFKGATLLTGG